MPDDLLHIRFPPDLKKAIKLSALLENKSITQWVVDTVGTSAALEKAKAILIDAEKK